MPDIRNSRVKMFVAILILFGFWNGVVGSEIYEKRCRLLVYAECHVSLENVAEKFLGNNKDLDSTCQSFLSGLEECVTVFLNKCVGNETVDEEVLKRAEDSRKLVNVIKKICRKDSDLHSKFVQHKACFQEVLETYREKDCSGYCERVFDHVRDNLLSQEIVTNKTKEFEVLIIFSQVCYVNCVLRYINIECGVSGKDTALEILENALDLPEILKCPAAIRLHIAKTLEAWNSVSKTGVFVKKLFRTDI